MDADDQASEGELDPAALRRLHRTTARWRRRSREMSQLRRLLEGEGDEAVLSYRVGAAEGAMHYQGLNGLGSIVEESVEAYYEDEDKKDLEEMSDVDRLVALISQIVAGARDPRSD